MSVRKIRSQPTICSSRLGSHVVSVFSKTHFAYLDVKTQFKLNNVPASAIFDELQRTYETDIYARLASPKGEWLETALVGRMQINLLRFDVALNLGRVGHLAADAVSTMAAHIFLLMDKENGPLGLGAEKRLSCLLVTNLKIDQAYRGTTVEREAVRTALIGLSTGVTRAFLDLGEEAAGDVRVANVGAERFAPIGFTPVSLGSRLLTINMDVLDFWTA